MANYGDSNVISIEKRLMIRTNHKHQTFLRTVIILSIITEGCRYINIWSLYRTQNPKSLKVSVLGINSSLLKAIKARHEVNCILE